MANRPKTFLPFLAALALGLLALAPATAPAKLPIPTEPARAQALSLIQKLFKVEYASKKPADKAALAQRLLKEALATHDDLTARYVLLDQSALLAADGGDPDTLTAALDLINAQFITNNPLPRQGALLGICLNNVTGAAIDRQVALAFNLMDLAVAADDFTLAARMADIAEEAAAKKQSVAFSASIQQRLRDFHALADEFKRAQIAAKTLQSADDPAAHLILGRFAALGKGDFSTGLPHLAKGADPALAAAAQADLAGPTTPDAQVKIGDLWWSIAELQTDYRRAQAAARAQYWYRQAKQTITGITLTKINARIGEGQPTSATAPGALATGHVDLLSLIDTDKDTVEGAWKRAEGGLVVTPGKYSRLQLPVRAPEEYDLILRFTRTEVAKTYEGTVALLLTFKDKSFDLSLEDKGGTARVEAIDKKAVKDNPTIVPLKLDNNEPYTVIVQVRKTGLHAAIDGKTLIDFKTDYADVGVYASWKLKDASLLGVGVHSAGVRFDKIELAPVTGQPRLLRGGN